MFFLHNIEKEQLRRLFQENRIDKFEKRFLILDFFLKTERHVTLSELSNLLFSKNVFVTSEFIDETMSLICRYGFAKKHKFDSGETRYEHMHLGQHHDHMICVKCDGIFEFKDDELEELQIKIAKNNNFRILRHKMELYGICSKCMEKCNEIHYLAKASQGERLLIVDFIGSKKNANRLSSIGLRLGDMVDVIINSGNGQLVIALGNRRLVLCRKIARKILVKVKNFQKK